MQVEFSEHSDTGRRGYTQACGWEYEAGAEMGDIRTSGHKEIGSGNDLALPSALICSPTRCMPVKIFPDPWAPPPCWEQRARQSQGDGKRASSPRSPLLLDRLTP